MASKSPYRKELLERLAFAFETCPSQVDEDRYKSEVSSPKELTQILAKAKAQKVFNDNPQAIVIGSDQVSVLDGEVLGKPKTFTKACEQLAFLSGKTHELITSVCILTPEKSFEFFDSTLLSMNKLNDEQIAYYVTKDDPLQCAGSYKIESLGISLFKEIKSNDFTAITGLPLMKLSSILRELNAIT